MGRPQFDTGRDNILSKPDYTKMSDETLLAEYESYRLKQKQMNLNQMAKKIALNSCYGSLGNRYSRYYDLRLATSITTMGQLSIRFIADRLNRRLNKVLETEGIDFVVYCVDGTTQIIINENEESISQLYDRIGTTSLDGVKLTHDRNLFTPSYNTTTETRECKRVTAVIKKTAVKKMFRVWVSDEKSVTVSEDHRFIVKRGKKTIETTVNGLLEDDVFINIHGYTQNGAYQ